jgi:hypothetical protein
MPVKRAAPLVVANVAAAVVGDIDTSPPSPPLLPVRVTRGAIRWLVLAVPVDSGLSPAVAMVGRLTSRRRPLSRRPTRPRNASDEDDNDDEDAVSVTRQADPSDTDLAAAGIVVDVVAVVVDGVEVASARAIRIVAEGVQGGDRGK